MQIFFKFYSDFYSTQKKKKKRTRDISGRQYKDEKNCHFKVTNPHKIVFKDLEKRGRYKVSVNRRIIPTGYIHERTLETLCLLADVEWIFNQIGWRS